MQASELAKIDSADGGVLCHRVKRQALLHIPDWLSDEPSHRVEVRRLPLPPEPAQVPSRSTCLALLRKFQGMTLPAANTAPLEIVIMSAALSGRLTVRRTGAFGRTDAAERPRHGVSDEARRVVHCRLAYTG